MKELSFDSGIVEYTVNGGHAISFCPGSDAFAKRFLDMLDKIKAIETVTEAEKEAVDRDIAKAFEYSEKKAEKINAEIDGIFGEGCAKALFPAGPRANGSGLPAWLNFCLCILDELYDNAEVLGEQANARMEKYMNKYRKYQRK